jgi:hypothetical protein
MAAGIAAVDATMAAASSEVAALVAFKFPLLSKPRDAGASRAVFFI